MCIDFGGGGGQKDTAELEHATARTRALAHTARGSAGSRKHLKGTGVIHLINVNRNEAIS